MTRAQNTIRRVRRKGRTSTLFLSQRQLRAHANEHIRSARVLNEAGLFKHAYRLASGAGAFMLKARYCLKHGVWKFPIERDATGLLMNTPMSARDLDLLMTLDEGPVRLRCEWSDVARLFSWNVDEGPDDARDLPREEVISFLTRMEKLIAELTVFEIVERLIPVEVALSETQGPFDLFAVVRGGTCSAEWGLVASATWKHQSTMMTSPALRQLAELIETALDEDLRRQMRPITWLEPDDRLLRVYREFPMTRHRVRYGVDVPPGGETSPPFSYIITNWLGSPSAKPQQPAATPFTSRQ